MVLWRKMNTTYTDFEKWVINRNIENNPVTLKHLKEGDIVLWRHPRCGCKAIFKITSIDNETLNGTSILSVPGGACNKLLIVKVNEPCSFDIYEEESIAVTKLSSEQLQEYLSEHFEDLL